MQFYPCSWNTREFRQKYIVVFVFLYFIVLHVFLVPFASFWVVSLVVVYCWPAALTHQKGWPKLH